MQQHQAKVRYAHLLDLLPIASLAERYAGEVTTMVNHPLCATTLMEGLAATILSDDGYVSVLEVDGKIVGGFWGILTNQPWSATKFAQDVIIVVDKGHRNGSGLMLIRHWIKWAKEKGAKEVYLSTASGIETQRFTKLAERIGFTSVGVGYRKEIA